MSENNHERVRDFIDLLDVMPWFDNIGKPLALTDAVKRIHRWEDWPGPEDPSVVELSERQQALHDELLSNADDGQLLTKLWEQVDEIVFIKAIAKVPYDAAKDAWHAPTSAV